MRYRLRLPGGPITAPVLQIRVRYPNHAVTASLVLYSRRGMGPQNRVVQLVSVSYEVSWALSMDP